MFALISWILFGLIIGALARLVLTGSDPMGWFATMAPGLAGAIVGGFVASLFWNASVFQPGGFSLAVLGAILLLLICHRVWRGAPVN